MHRRCGNRVRVGVPGWSTVGTMKAVLPATSLLLKPQPPYRFDYLLTYCTRRAGELVDRVEDGAYRRLFSLPAATVLADVRPDGGAALRLTLQTMNPSGGRSLGTEAAIEASLRRTLGLGDDLSQFEKATGDDPELAEIVHRFAGLRLVSTPTAFEAFVWAVIGQQISLHVAFRLKAALVRRYGVDATFGGSMYWAFPEPARLAEADPAELASLGLGRRKSATIVEIATVVASGALDLEALADVPLAEAEATLCALHGVGPWTASYTLLRGLRRADAFPTSDIGLRHACGILLNLDRMATVQEVSERAEHWRPFRGYAAFFLWFMLTETRRVTDDRSGAAV